MTAFWEGKSVEPTSTKRKGWPKTHLNYVTLSPNNIKTFSSYPLHTPELKQYRISVRLPEKFVSGFNPEDNQESISKWYSNLRQHFEKKENENDRNKEVTCRIMGATLKTAKGTTKKGDEDREKKHYFSRLVKPNKSLVDEELPDPDKVKNIRAMFQESANTSLDKKMDHHHQFGGSLQNISERSQMEQPVKRPLSAQCNRHDFLGELRANEILNGKKGCELESSDASRGQYN